MPKLVLDYMPTAYLRALDRAEEAYVNGTSHGRDHAYWMRVIKRITRYCEINDIPF